MKRTYTLIAVLLVQIITLGTGSALAHPYSPPDRDIPDNLPPVTILRAIAASLIASVPMTHLTSVIQVAPKEQTPAKPRRLTP